MQNYFSRLEVFYDITFNRPSNWVSNNKSFLPQWDLGNLKPVEFISKTRLSKYYRFCVFKRSWSLVVERFQMYWCQIYWKMVFTSVFYFFKSTKNVWGQTMIYFLKLCWTVPYIIRGDMKKIIVTNNLRSSIQTNTHEKITQ